MNFDNDVNNSKLVSPMKVVSDGTSLGTQVFDAEGNQIGLIQKIVWEVSVDSPYAKMTIEVLAVPIDAKAKQSAVWKNKPKVEPETNASITKVYVNDYWDKSEDLDNLPLGKIEEKE